MFPLFNPDSYIDENGRWHPATPPNPNIWIQPEDPTGDSKFHVPTPTPENPNNWGLQQNPLLQKILFLDHTHDPAGANYALNLEEEGVSREEIWDRTNWWRDPVGRWLKDIRADGIMQTKPLPKDPDMFLNYFDVPKHLRGLVREEGPDALDFFDTLRVRDIDQDPNKSPLTLGAYNPVTHTMEISNLDPEHPRRLETLYHEIQHAIQNRRGDAEANFTTPLLGLDDYMHNVQEANARLVGARDAKPDESYRAGKPPWEGYDVDPKKIKRGPSIEEVLLKHSRENEHPRILEIFQQMDEREALNIMDKYIREGLDPRWRP